MYPHRRFLIVKRQVIRTLLLSFCTLVCPVLPAQADGDARTWTNPIIRERADPQISLHSDGYYYFSATVPEYDRIELRRARSIGELGKAPARVVWRKHEHGPMSHHIWAPELHRIDGKWYLYFAAGKAEAIWDIRIYVLENSSPNPLEGDWVEKGQLNTGWESFALDATTFECNGARYLVWAQSEAPDPGTNLYIAKMADPSSLAGKAVCISRPELPWERRGHNVNEGPAVLQHEGSVFLSYSASATDANYCLGLLRADAGADLLDPQSWKKAQKPVFASNRATGQFGPGHNSFTTTPDGQSVVLVYHARNYEKIEGEPLYNPDRATRAQIIHWKADGTPDFGVPLPDDKQ
jgi:GH43 family beta-xylosidase